MRRIGIRFGLAGAVLALALASGQAAMAQTSNAGPDNPNSSVVTPGVAKPPASAPKPKGKTKAQPTGSTAVWANQPTLPQVALHPTATIGSPVPIAGQGGTTKAITGQ